MKPSALFNKSCGNILAYITAFLRWSFLGALMGAVGGVIGTAFAKSVEAVTDLRIANGWLLYLLPLGGLGIVALYKLCRVSGVGTNEVFEAVRTEKRVPVLLAPAVFLGSVITHLLGGSAGREGAALQLGGSIASAFSKLFRLKDGDRHILTVCGMGALFSAVFGTPLCACIFAVEVVSVGQFCSAALFPCMVSSVTAYGVALKLGISPERFAVNQIPSFGVNSLCTTLLIAVLAAVVSMLFCFCMHFFARLFKRYLTNMYLRIVVGGLLIVLLTLITNTRDYNGTGMQLISKIFTEGTVRPEAFLLKILFTAITIAAGYKGGEVVPTMFIGSAFGCAFAALIGADPAFGAAIGLIALFAGVTNCPIASLILGAELFGGDGILYYTIAAFVSFLLSGYFSLYTGQKIVFSKLSDEVIDINGK